MPLALRKTLFLPLIGGGRDILFSNGFRPFEKYSHNLKSKNIDPFPLPPVIMCMLSAGIGF